MEGTSISKNFETLKNKLQCSSCKNIIPSLVNNSSCNHTLCSSCCGENVCPCCQQKLNECDKTRNILLNGVILSIKLAVDSLRKEESRKNGSLIDDEDDVDNVPIKSSAMILDKKLGSLKFSPCNSTLSTSNKSPHFTHTKSLLNDITKSPFSTVASPLVKFGKTQKRNSKGETPLQIACKKNDIKAVKQLLENGTNPNTKDYAGWTPLHEAVLNSNLEITEGLLKAGALVNVPGFEQATPLHTAVCNGFLEIVQLLLKHGADMSLRDINGKTARILASNEIRNIMENRDNIDNKLENYETMVPPRPTVVFILEEIESKIRDKFSRFATAQHIKLVSTVGKDVSHIVVPANEKNICKATIPILKGILFGAAIVNSDWLLDSLAHDEIMNFEPYEVNGTLEYPNDDGPRKARLNFMKLLPPLFEGCKIYLHSACTGEFDKYVMTELVKCSGASLISRSPDPEYLEMDRCLFHCEPGHSMERTSTIVLYEDGSLKEPKLKYNMAHVKTLPVTWFLKCIETFSICKS